MSSLLLKRKLARGRDAPGPQCNDWAGHDCCFKNVCGKIGGMNAGDPAVKGVGLIESFDGTNIGVEQCAI